MARRLELAIAAGILTALALCAAAGFAPPAIASATAAQSAAAPCFFRRDWRGGWKAAPDARAIYIRVSGSVYRLGLQSSYSLLKDPFAILSNKDSAEQICTPLDFRLIVSNRVGAEQSPIVTSMTRLTPQAVAALPKRLRP